ncbi:class I SAM-dependent methyltransferase [Streptomyces sp. TRM 70361]|uniref:class I SAM-dependent methyltransferase n=1 Tax=Streptomyces sp. TRM 70361 TaxID=3116553 RepID=UPI002E7B52A0|nr:class I SAM-dependent methyltransferase [Streptomyces sp. TRM 70361]MEE1940610.1 class I SAM-dependent methyltransferase [Streptomyces sp. TRM 70361]
MGRRIWNPAGSQEASPSGELARLARSHRFASVLDAGCGWGRNLAALATTADVLHGFDLDEEGVRATRKRLAGAGTAAGPGGTAEVRIWVDDLLTAAPGRTYELVICYGVLHFLPRERRLAAYDRLESWTAPGGVLALASFNAAVPVPADLRELIPEPPADSGEVRERFARWEDVYVRSHVFEDEHEGGVRHTHSIDRLVVRAPRRTGGETGQG